MTRRRTRRQQEVLDHLIEQAALSREKAHWVYGADATVADNLARIEVLNKRYDAKHGAVYWIRKDDEKATGATVPTGFIVYLNRDVTTPAGRKENFFLGRALYNGTNEWFRRPLRGWMRYLGLRRRDLLDMPADMIPPDDSVFEGDHVIMDDL